MTTNTKNWEFPIKQFKINEGYLCILREEDAKKNEYFPDEIGASYLTTGMRLECNPIMVPGGAYGYEEDIEVTPEVMIDMLLPYDNLSDLSDSSLVFKDSDSEYKSIGSMYLFAIHNDVRCSEIRFGGVTGDTIYTELDLEFDVDYDAGELEFKHTLRCNLKLEPRWEL